MTSSPWTRIRSLRAEPPELAESGLRRRVFNAALQQCEELFAAANAAGAATKSLPLFYALSQAGRAISAAHNVDDTWAINGHGITARVQPAKLGETRISAKANKL